MKQTILNLWQENGTLSIDNSKVNYDVTNGITYNAKVLKYNLGDYNDA